jgi:orotidine-5'-phosphate decarboxylase
MQSAFRQQILRNSLIVALDVDSLEQCVQLAELLRGKIGAFKIGPRLLMRYGASIVEILANDFQVPVFVDNKYLDIPNTMESAIRATFAAGATFATVHAWAGSEALKRLARLEADLQKIRPFKILVVTVLTSFSPETLPPGLIEQPILSHVDKLTELIFDCGLTGVVCSPHEVSSVRAIAEAKGKSSDALLITPGVRLPGDARGDQKRVETPYEAIRLGASAIVVGRPIIEASAPAFVADQILSSISEKI